MLLRLIAGLSVALFTLPSSAAAGGDETDESEAALKKEFVGVWVGTMEQVGFDPFPVQIELSEFKYGKWCGVIKHDAPIDAEGQLLGCVFEGGYMILSASITRGRDRCQDGLSEIKLIDHNTMERSWYDPATGKVAAKGTLKRKGYQKTTSENEKYRSEDGKFELGFPKGSKVETTTQKSDGADMHIFEAVDARKQYMVLYTDFPEEVVMSVEAKTIFDGGIEGSINKNGGEITSSKDYTIGEHNFSARDAIISWDKQRLHLRMILAETRFYLFSVGGPEDSLSDDEATEFLDSFEITE